LFTDPTTIGDLTDAVGGPINLSQQDLELCLQARDDGLGDLDEQQASSFGRIAATLDQCLQALDQVGPDPDGVEILQRASRLPADPTYTSARTLERLEQAVGDLALTRRDLETCADAFHQSVLLEQSPLNTFNVAPGCQPCGTAGCCPSGQVCQLPSCRNCQPVCVTQGCFPATATVQLEGGAQKAIHDVRLGDRILVARADGSLGYEEVYLNTHKDAVSAAPYVELALASGRSLTLSPRHFIPVAAGPASAWADQVAKGANEIAVGDFVWSRADDGQMVPDEVTAARTTVAVGAYNPLTMNGTIVVDGVVASAHSDWFLDGIVSADAQTKVYQAILAPVRVAYRALGPARMETITEGWGVVDFVREATTPSGRSSGPGWIWPAVVLLAALGAAFLWRRRSAAHQAH
jgi:MYXO-CTERM domain-containing protein